MRLIKAKIFDKIIQNDEWILLNLNIEVSFSRNNFLTIAPRKNHLMEISYENFMTPISNASLFSFFRFIARKFYIQQKRLLQCVSAVNVRGALDNSLP